MHIKKLGDIMNKRFEKIHLIRKNSLELKKYSNDNKTEMELIKERELTDKVLDFYKKTIDKDANGVDKFCFTFDFLGAGYNQEDGYYIVYNGNFGCYKVLLFNDNIDLIFINLCDDIIRKQSMDNLYYNKNSINKSYSERFGDIVDTWLIYQVEFILDKWDK